VDEGRIKEGRRKRNGRKEISWVVDLTVVVRCYSGGTPARPLAAPGDLGCSALFDTKD
jgi:hypothetical protein